MDKRALIAGPAPVLRINVVRATRVFVDADPGAHRVAVFLESLGAGFGHALATASLSYVAGQNLLTVPAPAVTPPLPAAGPLTGANTRRRSHRRRRFAWSGARPGPVPAAPRQAPVREELYVYLLVPTGTEVHLELGQSDLYVGEPPATLFARISAGDVDLASVGKADVRVGHGDIRIRSSAGRLAADTGAGHIEALRVGGVARLRNGDGDIGVLCDNPDRLVVIAPSGHALIQGEYAWENVLREHAR
ncbi:hypothetical protein [Bailinhaonella thermotolerans]|uniref:Uncharacterized protein n=1 Tax=Bailinhaonella thermotolerans TaxID=1070861 RepID=A0A3A4A1M8_9ACTN|nr:hypothetical protein [Bailinhaonella thermotolerans]RJL21256.1 hypothetical protein D5H75_37965 [Bailinhaonella thermotolerans]